MNRINLADGPFLFLPSIPYSLEIAGIVHRTILERKPDCVAVALSEELQDGAVAAASRLPDLTLLHLRRKNSSPSVILSEPCDPSFEAVRTALDEGIAAFCIGVPGTSYPLHWDRLPDSYAIQRIGYPKYSEEVLCRSGKIPPDGESGILHLARRLRELSFSYERILVVLDFSLIQAVQRHLKDARYPEHRFDGISEVWITSPTEESCREILLHGGWFSSQYEQARRLFHGHPHGFPPDRQKLLLQLYKAALVAYLEEEKRVHFPPILFRQLMKFARNYAWLKGQLLPDFFQMITAAKGCVDSNYAYHVWQKASAYEERKNVDGLPETSISPEELWGAQKQILFRRTLFSRKAGFLRRSQQEKRPYSFRPLSPFALCSYPPEDISVENFGRTMQRKGQQILWDDSARTIPFATSLEEGIDVRETIRHWMEKKIYVRKRGASSGKVGSVIVIFDEDRAQKGERERYPFCTTWLGEHNQESDMAFFSTPMGMNVVGPGISRCEYGGFLMSYPPRRLQDIWRDPDYSICRSKAEVLLAAGIEYSVESAIVFAAERTPRSWFHTFAQRMRKKVIFIPLGTLSPVQIRQLRCFHILDHHHRRETAGEYIY